MDGGPPPGTPLSALRHRAEVVLAAVEVAHRQLGAIRQDAGEGDTVGALCDVLHALDASAELAHAVAATPAVDITPPAYGFTAPAARRSAAP